MDLNLPSRIKFPDLNSTCDPVLSKFYTHVLDSLRGIQRTVTRLSSIHGVTDLFECDSYLRRFYTYVSGFTSTLNCPTRHYANSLHACKSWAIRACKILTPGERAWLKGRNKRSSYWCHAGLAGVPRFFYMLGGGKCESSSYSNLIQVLFEFSKTMSEAHNLVKNLNGKIVYLVKTTDLVNSKVTQVIASLRLISRSFSVWQKQVSSFASKVTCHFNMQQEFTSLFAIEVNKALTSLLRLTEVDDLLRQIAHLTKRNLIGYADLPRFLTEEISLKLSSVVTLAPAINALKNGFSVMLNPLVDTKFPSQRKLQMHFLFLLPVLSSSASVCTMEQLIPITYRVNDACYGGILPRHDLRLLTCQTKQYIIKETELHHCAQTSDTILCPKDLLATVDSPDWLGPKWSSASKLVYQHTHVELPSCTSLHQMLHIGGRLYLATDQLVLPIQRHNDTIRLPIFPLHIYQFPCDYSFHSQSTGLANCPTKLTFQFPLFHNGQFHFIPWQTVSEYNDTVLSTRQFLIPKPLTIDNRTLVSLNKVYNSLDQDFTRHLTKLNSDIASVKEVPDSGISNTLVYFSLALAVFDLIIVLVFYCVLSKRVSVPRTTSAATSV